MLASLSPWRRGQRSEKPQARILQLERFQEECVRKARQNKRLGGVFGDSKIAECALVFVSQQIVAGETRQTAFL